MNKGVRNVVLRINKKLFIIILIACLLYTSLHTVYIGGGTPSLLNEDQIDRIFKAINKHYDLSEIREITFEAGRPDTLNKGKLVCLKNNLVNRISINLSLIHI